MATYFISDSRGDTKSISNMAVATSAPSADLYLQILTTNNPTKEDVVLFLNRLRQYILSNGLPAGQTGVDLPQS